MNRGKLKLSLQFSFGDFLEFSQKVLDFFELQKMTPLEVNRTY